jgi:hypothetical protein
MAATNSLDNIVSDAAYYITPPLTERLKKMAAESGWPAQIADALFISFDGSNLAVDQPPALKDAVDDLEYGKGSTLPNSVIRSLKYRSDDIVRDVYLDRSVLKLFESEDIFGE